TIWVDVEVPHLDHLWEPDVGRAFNWLGCVWAGALDSLGLGPAMVHSGALLRREWSERICFVGLGPGELTVDGRKVLGISQRRSREGAVFSCAAYLRLHPGALPSLLALSDAARELATAASEASSGALGAGLAVGVRRADVEAAFLERLP
ncbi:MAG: hypothetical protein ACRDX8_13165, partial [Acidimicrobiales bacterium]